MQFLHMTIYGMMPSIMYTFESIKEDGVWRVWVNGIEIWAN